jgi:hypothetical protein
MGVGVGEVLRNSSGPEMKFAKSGIPARLLTSKKKNGDIAEARVAERRIFVRPWSGGSQLQ